MQLLLTPEQDDLRAAVRGLLTTRASSVQVRAAMTTATGHDPDLWRRLGTELGVLGLPVPEAAGGAGAGHTERAVVAEELGRAVAPSPFLGSAVLAVDMLAELGSGADLLAQLASGARLGALAVAEPGSDGAFDVAATATRATVTRAAGGVAGWVLDGRKTPVVDGAVADLLLVYAGTDEGAAMFAVDGSAPGLTRTALRTLDPTRRLARIDLAGVPATLLPGDADAALVTVADLATVALGAGQVGGMARAIELTVQYAGARVQFGRRIGSYQAVKHGLADMYVAHELACSALRYGCWAADHDRTHLPEAAALLGMNAGPAYFRAASAMVQYHGGIGYTWEHDAHLFYKRAKSDELLLGSTDHHLSRLADLLAV